MKEYIVINQENIVNGVIDQKVIPITNIQMFYTYIDAYLRNIFTNDHEIQNIIIDLMSENKHDEIYVYPIKHKIWISNDIEQKWIHKHIDDMFSIPRKV